MPDFEILRILIPKAVVADPFGITASILTSIIVSTAVSATSFLVSRLFAPKPKPYEKGKLQGDVFVQDSQFGIAIPRIYGDSPEDDGRGGIRTGGNIIWTSGIHKTVTTKKGGGGGKGPRQPDVKEYEYDLDIAIMVGEGPLRIEKVWANTELIYRRDQPDAGTGTTGVYDGSATTDGPANNLLLPDPEAVYTANVTRFNLVPTEDVNQVVAETLAAGAYADIRIYPGTETQPVDPTIQAAIDGDLGTGFTPAYRGRCYVVLKKFSLTKYGGALPNFTFLATHRTIKTLDTVCAALCSRAGLSSGDYDFSALSGIDVRGFFLGQRQSPKQALEMLARAYGVDFVESDGKIFGVVQGGASAATVPSTDLGAVEGNAPGASSEPVGGVEASFLDTPQLPVAIETKFFDPRRDHATNLARERRFAAVGEQHETIDLPLCLTPKEANDISYRELFQAWVERNGYVLTLPWKWAWLKPTDVVTVSRDGFTHTIRATEITGAVPGPLKLVGVASESAVYNPDTAGEGGDGFGDDPTAIPVQTVGTLFTIPFLRADDDSGGYYGACCPRGAGQWGGATLFKDRGLGYESVAEFPAPCVLGRAVTVLANFTGTGWDTSSTVTVDLYLGSLESASATDVLLGANMAVLGGEVIQWQTATKDSNPSHPNRWTLTNLRRGVRRTASAISTHVLNERFVLVGTGLQFLPTNPTEYNTSRNFKFVTTGGTIDDAATLAFTWTGGVSTGKSTDRVTVSKIDRAFLGEIQYLPESLVGFAVFVEIDNYQTDLTKNADSIDYASVTAFDKFGNPIRDERRYPHNGFGKVGEGVHTRNAADPLENEAVYRVTLHNPFGNSDPIWIRNTGFSLTTPTWADPNTTPHDLKATAISDTQVSLSWIYIGASGLNALYRVKGTVTWTLAGAVLPKSNLVGALQPNTDYEFVLETTTGALRSNVASAKTLPANTGDPQFPAPAGLTATAASSTAVDLTWMKGGATHIGTEVYRDGSLVTTTSASAKDYTDSGRTSGATHVYKVRHVYSTGVSAYSNEVTITLPLASAANPTNLQATVAGPYSVSLTWTSNGGTGSTTVESRIPGVTQWATFATLAGGASSYTATGLVPGTTYRFRIKNNNGNTPSNYVEVTTFDLEDQPGL